MKNVPINGMGFFSWFIALLIPKNKNISIDSSIVVNRIIGILGNIIIVSIVSSAPNIPKPNACFRWYLVSGDFPPLLYSMKDTIQPTIVI
ncbi:hypothetical protein [Flavobacterium xinjiangense]|uniref:Uncharacterized protein n=1 Tax=Flavobacterium xinjiangense TaxID=178356 RepID=A0A1M7PGF8_9FLAO|nr:hypothetical protein [Flavobacterium xinjiangense]SHN16085.1 hypothetical protein SAMN05216269_11724 [Flavobacterium xinjiangense]